MKSKFLEDWHNARETFSAAMAEAESVLLQSSEGMRADWQDLLRALLYDAYRTGVAIQVLLREGLLDRRISAESVELLARHILERVILSSFIRKHASADVVARYYKTCALEQKEVLGRSFDKESENLPVKRLPKTSQMAEDVGGDLREAYRLLSYTIHPRVVPPYSGAEHVSGLSPQEYFCGRLTNLLQVTVRLLTILTRNFAESQDDA